MEERQVTRIWFQIAKSEFLIQTSRFRGRRKIVLPAALIFAVVWAIYIFPTIMLQLIGQASSSTTILLETIFPGLMRSAMLLVWLMLLIYPMSSALREIKIGQWEILLSHDVRTRSIMFGSYLAKIPVYGLITLLLSPVLVSPFAIIFKISLIGQLIMYLILFFIAISTLWLATFLTTAIQARLGDSPRGNDLAKALTYILAIVLVIPLYSVIWFSASVSQFLGLNIFLVFPFTWGADLISWTAISFSGVSFSQPITNFFQSTLGFGWSTDLLLLSAFSLVIVGLSFVSAGRLFRIGAGPRMEKIVTVRRDGPIMRLIRRASPGSFGILLTGTLKDFMRKAQNVSQLAYLVIMSIIFPLLLNSAFSFSSKVSPDMALYITGGVLGIFASAVGALTFGGIGFLDSKDQLWIIQTAPKGASKFVLARVVEAFLMVLIVATIPAISLYFVLNYSLVDTLILWVYMYAALCCAAMVGIGVCANNPAYDDTQSAAFTKNRTIAGVLVAGTNYGWFYISAILFHPWLNGLPVALVILIAPLLLAGVLTIYVGARRFAQPIK
jgi:hypothetical protein